jgi:hypothetical protein
MKSEIRDRLNAASTPWQIIGERRWQLANGALDAIDDANTAIWTYFAMDWPKGAGSQLLVVYGLFQATTIQQDGSIELVAAARNSEYRKVREEINRAEPVLSQNRDLRDRLVGHPANKNWKTDSPTAATFYRTLQNRERLTAGLYAIDGGDFQRKDIDVVELVETQARALSSSLASTVTWAANPR